MPIDLAPGVTEIVHLTRMAEVLTGKMHIGEVNAENGKRTGC